MRDARNIGLTYSIDCSRLINDIYIIDNNICYPKQVFHNIKYLFETKDTDCIKKFIHIK